jgi:Ca2+-binding RTX toxin-like protein
MGRTEGSSNGRGRAKLGLLPFAALIAVLVGLVVAAASSARAKPTCFGKPATIVGNNNSNTISGTARKDVIYAGGGNDKIEARNHKVDHGRDIICGGNGSDKIVGDNKSEKIIGGPGKDVVTAGNGNDLIVGDNANPKGNESGPTGKDDLAGSGGDDFMVGDNWATGSVSGASNDINFRAAAGRDTVIGDDASVGRGNATGGGNDRLGGANGNDLVVGDSYAKSGVATGGGNDDNNSGPGKDVAVGDSYSETGKATTGGGSAIDELQGADGGDFGKTCKRGACDDVFYGDSFVASCGDDATIVAITCQAARATGGGPDRLTPDQGNDFMNGGLPDPDQVSGSADNVDRCAGGKGTDTATRCKDIQDGFERSIFFP